MINLEFCCIMYKHTICAWMSVMKNIDFKMSEAAISVQDFHVSLFPIVAYCSRRSGPGAYCSFYL